ncbi:MAG: hypothetical protein MHPSP_003648, partial [Paramarteilia canceri]
MRKGPRPVEAWKAAEVFPYSRHIKSRTTSGLEANRQYSDERKHLALEYAKKYI